MENRAPLTLLQNTKFVKWIDKNASTMYDGNRMVRKCDIWWIDNK